MLVSYSQSVFTIVCPFLYISPEANLPAHHLDVSSTAGIPMRKMTKVVEEEEEEGYEINNGEQKQHQQGQ